MPIVPSRSARIQELVGRLASGRAAERDSAVAGLTLIGARGVEALGAFLPHAGPAARLAAIEILERIEDRGSLSRILELAGDPDEKVALRALEAAGSRPDPRAVEPLSRVLASRVSGARRRAAALALARLQAAGLVEALDPLAALLLDEREEGALRAAVLRALVDLDPPLRPGTLRPLLKRLAASADPGLRALASATGGKDAPSSRQVETRLVEKLVSPGTSEAAVARTIHALAHRGAPAIPALQEALERLGPPRGSGDAASLRSRAAVHEALAALGSRVALYDLREGISARPRGAMPALLRAAGRIGDVSVVPALARAVAEETAWLDACASALAEVVAREGLRKPAARAGVRPEHRTAFDLLWERAKALRKR